MAIRDQGYTRYEGDLSRGTPPALVIATTEWSIYWSYLRTKLLFIFLMIVPVIFLIISFGERVVMKTLGANSADPDKVTGFYEFAFGYVEVWMLAIMLAAAGCGVIADDMRHRTIQLYFSKPIRPIDYIAGKFLSLVFLGGLVTILPMLVIGLVRFLVFAPSKSAGAVAINLLMLWLFTLILLSVFSLMVMALSCLTPRKGFVVLSWLATLLVPSLVSTIAGAIKSDAQWTELLSIAGTMGTALKVMVQAEVPPGMGDVSAKDLPGYMTYAPFIIIAALALGSVAIIHWRTSKLEGIA